MCDPLTALAIGGMALSAGGTFLSTQEANANQRRMVNARNEAAEAEFARQRQYQDESSGVFDRTLAAFQPQQQRQQLASAQRQRSADTIAAIPNTGVEGVSLSGSAPKVVSEGLARALGSAHAGAAADAGRLGKLNAWDDLLFGNNLRLTRSGERLSDVGGFSRVSASLLPGAQQAAANNAYRAPSGFADLLKIAGTGTSMAGFLGANPFGSGAGAARGPTWGPYGKAGLRPY